MMGQGAANNTDDGARRSTNMAGMEEAQRVGGENDDARYMVLVIIPPMKIKFIP
jgi:hypothetical protein